MKRQLGTALSVLALLGVGAVAAAVNVRMLQDAGGPAAQFSMQSTSDVAPLAANNLTALPRGSAESGTAGGRIDPRRLGSVGVGPTDHEGRERHGFGDGDRPVLTEAQVNLLRVAAMVRVDPRTVLDVAQGRNTESALVAAVSKAARAVGITMQDLAAVKAPPPIRDRGHGGPGDHDGFAFDSRTATQTYDD